MFILGISGVFGHDAAACLVQDGKVLAMVEEERLTRIKHALGTLPIQSIFYCLQSGNITLNDIDCVTLSWDPSLDPTATYLREFEQNLFQHELWQRFTKPAVEYVPHHLAHAASSYYASGFDEAAILVIDGHGEDVATSIGYGKGYQLQIDQKMSISHSLGHFYHQATRYVGLGGQDEGKLMGLASYGEPIDNIDVIHLDSEGYHIDLLNVDNLPAPQRYARLGQAWREWFQERFGAANAPQYGWSSATGMKRQLDLPLHFANVAASVQQCLTQTILHLARYATEHYQTRNIVLAGGVALNCSANGVLLRSGIVDQLYVVPAANDAGGALGAALYVSAAASPVQALPTVYLGPSFDHQDVVTTLCTCQLRFQEVDDIYRRTATLLAEGKIVGWFQGGMEVGPRALGNRSILALPTSTEVRDRVNTVKGRELWRPLSPSLLDTAISDVLTYSHPSPYMLTAIPVKQNKVNVIPAVVHVDGTVRPQVVSQASNERYWRLLQAVHQQTGVPGVLNTSFNLAGEPIVCKPSDAVRSFSSSALDALVIGDVLLEK